jgi:hypothetical protein
MKKSLVLASLLLIGTSSIAGNYMKLEYEVGANECDKTTLGNPKSACDYDGYRISWNRNAKKYILAAGYLNSNSKKSKYIYNDTEMSYDSEDTHVYIDGALKIELSKNIFFAPWLSYADNSKKYRYTTLSTGKKTYYEGSSDTDLSTGVYVGYSLKHDVDSYAYLSLTIDDDLLEVEEHDYHHLKFGINYAINVDYILSGSYSQNLSKDKLENGETTVINSSSFVFGVGYIF